MATASLDIECLDALVEYLVRTGRASAGEILEIRVLAGGVSNRTVLVRLTGAREWVIKQALDKLRVQVDWFSDPARIHREALGLRRLETLVPGVPAFVFEDHDHHLLAMQAVPEPHENWKTLLLAGRVDAAHVREFAGMLAQIHRQAYERREMLQPLFADAAFFESLRLEPYYAYAAAQVPVACGFLHELIRETRGRQLTLVHGDYSPKNILVHAGRLVLLDHEVIHWGDPAFDVGFALTHLLSKANHVAAHREAFAAAALTFWSAYSGGVACCPWAADLERFAVRHTLACLLARVAGRSQLEYLTPDEKIAQRDAVLALLGMPMGDMPSMIGAFVTGLR